MLVRVLSLPEVREAVYAEHGEGMCGIIVIGLLVDVMICPTSGELSNLMSETRWISGVHFRSDLSRD